MHFVTQHNLMQPDTTIVIGLSGGPDSVFLLHLLQQLRAKKKIQRIIAAHLDHQWRPNSWQDAEFCKNLALHYNVEFVSTTWQELDLAHLPKGSKENQGRIARRHFLSQIAHTHKADVIALAHHRDDQQETFFIRLLRGASLSGLIGMRPKQGLFIRPLLMAAKTDMLAFLKLQNIPYLIDPSNTSEEFLRNRIRMHVIPALRSCDERFDKSFERTLSSLQETEDFLQHLTESTFENISQRVHDIYQLDAQALLSQHPALLKRLVLHWLISEKVQFPTSKGFLDEIITFLQAGTGAHSLHRNWRIIKKQRSVCIQKIL